MAFISKTFTGRRIAGIAFALIAFQHARAQDASGTIFHRYAVMSSAVEKANQEVEAHRFEEAKRDLDPVLEKIPDHAGAHFLLARMAYESRDYAGALNHIEISERSLTDLGRRYSKLMQDASDKDDADAQAIKQSMQNIVDAGYDSVNDILVDGQQKLNQIEDGKRGLFRQGASFTIPAASSLLHGNCLYRLGRKPEAITEYQKAIKAEPASQKAWNNLIAVYLEIHQKDQARQALAEAEARKVSIQSKLRQAVMDAH